MNTVSHALRRVGVAAYDARRAFGSGTSSSFRFYRDALATRQRMLSASTAVKETETLRLLREAVRRASTIPFWAERFRAAGLDWTRDFSFDDFKRVPVLSRTDIASVGDGLLSSSAGSSDRRKMATGGSSGTPTVTWTGPLERAWIESGIEFFEGRVGLSRYDSRALLWGHNLDPIARAGVRDRAEDWLWNRRWYDCFRLSPAILTEYHRDMTQFRPAVVLAYATALSSFAQTVQSLGEPVPTYPTLGFVTGAEKLLPEQRALIETVFQRPVYERYGGRDLGFLAMQSPGASHDFTIDWMNVLVEPEHDREEDSIVVTKLHADAMPLFRYRSGDIGRFPSNAAARPVFTLHEVVGRELQRVARRDGGWMHGTVIPHLLKDFPLKEYQLHQSADLAVTLSYVPLRPLEPAQVDAIMTALHDNLPDIPVELRIVDAVPRTAAGKWLPVVSEATPGVVTASGGGA